MNFFLLITLLNIFQTLLLIQYKGITWELSQAFVESKNFLVDIGYFMLSGDNKREIDHHLVTVKPTGTLPLCTGLNLSVEIIWPNTTSIS